MNTSPALVLCGLIAGALSGCSATGGTASHVGATSASDTLMWDRLEPGQLHRSQAAQSKAPEALRSSSEIVR